MTEPTQPDLDLSQIPALQAYVIYGLVAAREFVEIRVTPSGLVRVGEVQKGTPAYAKDP